MVMKTLQKKQRPALILIVEDNPGDVLMIKRAFRQAKMPYEMMIATSGEEALAILGREEPYTQAMKPDIILLDLNLPKMSGKEVLSEIKKNEAFKLIPVMVLSSSSAEQDVVSSYALHANSYIVKPSDLQESLAVVEKVEQLWFTLAVLPEGTGFSGGI